MSYRKQSTLPAWKAGLAQLILLVSLGAGATQVGAQEFNWAPQYPVGTAIPDIDAPDQNGARRSFENLKGDKGLLFMLSRSFDW